MDIYSWYFIQVFRTPKIKFLLLQIHSKTVKFAMEIQPSPYCEKEARKTQEQGQFYVGTDQQMFHIYLRKIKLIILMSEKIS